MQMTMVALIIMFPGIVSFDDGRLRDQSGQAIDMPPPDLLLAPREQSRTDSHPPLLELQPASPADHGGLMPAPSSDRR
jgi:hypothetical protein